MGGKFGVSHKSRKAPLFRGSLGYCKTGGNMANKTQENDADVAAFLESIEHPVRRADARAMLGLLGRVTGLPAKMWARQWWGLAATIINMKAGARGI